MQGGSGSQSEVLPTLSATMSTMNADQRGIMEMSIINVELDDVMGADQCGMGTMGAS